MSEQFMKGKTTFQKSFSSYIVDLGDEENLDSWVLEFIKLTVGQSTWGSFTFCLENSVSSALYCASKTFIHQIFTHK